jgi:hypothetical protein
MVGMAIRGQSYASKIMSWRPLPRHCKDEPRLLQRTRRHPPPRTYAQLIRSQQFRGHMGRQSQAPKQVLGVVTLHAICEE